MDLGGAGKGGRDEQLLKLLVLLGIVDDQVIGLPIRPVGIRAVVLLPCMKIKEPPARQPKIPVS